MKTITLSDGTLLIDEETKAMNHWYHITDNRPLTDETLIELGFKPLQETEHWWLSKKLTESLSLITEGGKHQELYTVSISCEDSPRYATVGSVRMLIEAPKGDE